MEDAIMEENMNKDTEIPVTKNDGINELEGMLDTDGGKKKKTSNGLSEDEIANLKKRRKKKEEEDLDKLKAKHEA